MSSKLGFMDFPGLLVYGGQLAEHIAGSTAVAPAYAVLPLDTLLQRYEGAIGLFRAEDPDMLPQLSGPLL